jgi:hypothetical protein
VMDLISHDVVDTLVDIVKLSQLLGQLFIIIAVASFAFFVFFIVVFI